MKIRILKITVLFLPVLLGGIIYVIFRTEKLIMFRWFECLNISQEIFALKKYSNNYVLPDWFIFSLPDGLWIYSYTSILLEIWKYSITKQNLFWIFSIPITAILSEFFQFFKIIPGTFDFTDVIFYLIGIMIPFISQQKQFNTEKL
ncbi:hypothetical protein [Chryseobacterium hagamense]|uniref:VanZ-like domain-containing protein n=1 Tax=Chryseobacterium hagamense TaxID=395935 RepID=A0A511YJV4_9FLAO|nr:hypothetical protein [Chryseobacterium hagamense]GEN75490.1 hypothetical protein CHA01nite_12300 [Chryseobacterium hagamense]